MLWWRSSTSVKNDTKQNLLKVNEWYSTLKLNYVPGCYALTAPGLKNGDSSWSCILQQQDKHLWPNPYQKFQNRFCEISMQIWKISGNQRLELYIKDYEPKISPSVFLRRWTSCGALWRSIFLSESGPVIHSPYFSSSSWLCKNKEALSQLSQRSFWCCFPAGKNLELRNIRQSHLFSSIELTDFWHPGSPALSNA